MCTHSTCAGKDTGSESDLIVMQISTLVGHPLCNGIPTIQHNIDTHSECPAYYSPWQQYRDCAVDSVSFTTLTIFV